MSSKNRNNNLYYVKSQYNVSILKNLSKQGTLFYLQLSNILSSYEADFCEKCELELK